MVEVGGLFAGASILANGQQDLLPVKEDLVLYGRELLEDTGT